MKKIFTLLLLVISFSVNAQITIDDTDMVQADDTFRVSVANVFTSGIDLTQTGANFTWDYSTLVADTQVVDSFLTVGSTGGLYPIFFINIGFNSNRANVAQKGDLSNASFLPVTNPYFFYYNTSARFIQTGIGGNLGAVQVPVGFTDKDVIYNFPLNFADNDSSDATFQAGQSGTGSLNGSRHRVNEVDGWGSLTTPYGTFDVLRVVSDFVDHDSVHIDSSGQDIVYDMESTEYKWIAKGEGIPVLQINTIHIFGTDVINSIRYRDSVRNEVPTGLNTINQDAEKMEIVGNPASDAFILRANSAKANNLNVKIMDASGRICMIQNQKAIVGVGEYVIDTRKLSAGVYFVNVEKEGSDQQNTMRLVISK